MPPCFHGSIQPGASSSKVAGFLQSNLNVNMWPTLCYNVTCDLVSHRETIRSCRCNYHRGLLWGSYREWCQPQLILSPLLLVVRTCRGMFSLMMRAMNILLVSINHKRGLIFYLCYGALHPVPFGALYIFYYYFGLGGGCIMVTATQICGYNCSITSNFVWPFNNSFENPAHCTEARKS